MFSGIYLKYLEREISAYSSAKGDFPKLFWMMWCNRSRLKLYISVWMHLPIMLPLGISHLHCLLSSMSPPRHQEGNEILSYFLKTASPLDLLRTSQAMWSGQNQLILMITSMLHSFLSQLQQRTLQISPSSLSKSVLENPWFCLASLPLEAKVSSQKSC